MQMFASTTFVTCSSISASQSASGADHHIFTRDGVPEILNPSSHVGQAQALSSDYSTSPSHVAFPPKRITGWEPFLDYPHPPDHEDLGITYEYDFSARPTKTSIRSLEPSFSADAIVDEELAEKISVAEAEDKLAGWPLWVQGPEYPDCPTCRSRMRLLFQLDSNDHLDFMFGDVGTGHITQCPVHKDVVAFGWACS